MEEEGKVPEITASKSTEGSEFLNDMAFARELHEIIATPRVPLYKIDDMNT